MISYCPILVFPVQSGRTLAITGYMALIALTEFQDDFSKAPLPMVGARLEQASPL